jgi:hypothetical protein
MNPLAVLGIAGGGYLLFKKDTPKVQTPREGAGAPVPPPPPPVIPSGKNAGNGNGLQLANLNVMAVAQAAGGFIGNFAAEAGSFGYGENHQWTNANAGALGSAIAGAAVALMLYQGAALVTIGIYAFPIAVGVFAVISTVGAVEADIHSGEGLVHQQEVNNLVAQKKYKQAFERANFWAEHGFYGLGFKIQTENYKDAFGVDGGVIQLQNGTTVDVKELLMQFAKPLTDARDKWKAEHGGQRPTYAEWMTLCHDKLKGVYDDGSPVELYTYSGGRTVVVDKPPMQSHTLWEWHEAWYALARRVTEACPWIPEYGLTLGDREGGSWYRLTAAEQAQKAADRADAQSEIPVAHFGKH